MLVNNKFNINVYQGAETSLRQRGKKIHKNKQKTTTNKTTNINGLILSLANENSQIKLVYNLYPPLDQPQMI